METVLRIQINVICAVFLTIAFISVHRYSIKGSGAKDPDVIIFYLFVFSTFSILAIDAVSWLLLGRPGQVIHHVLNVLTVLYFSFHGLPPSLYVMYADYQVNQDVKRTKKLTVFAILLISLVIAAALSSPFTGLIFLINEKNNYVRGWGFTIFNGLLIGAALLAFIPVVLSHTKTTGRVFMTLLVYPIPLIIAAILQQAYFGLVLIWPTTAVFLVAAALNIQGHRSSIDHLTGTANRRSLDVYLKQLVHASGSGKNFAGILVDLDDFKLINDTYGHDAGDRALEEAAAILRSSVRREDFIARFGGDEFVLLLPGANERIIDEVTRRIRQTASACQDVIDQSFTLSFSIGAALYDQDMDSSPDAFLSRLDSAMYSEKMMKKARKIDSVGEAKKSSLL